MPVPPPYTGKTSAHATPSKLNARVRNAASQPGHVALRCLVSLQTNSCQGDPLQLAGWAFLQMAYLSEPPWAERMGLSLRSCPGSRYSGGISPTTSTQHTHARLDRGAVSITQVSPAKQVTVYKRRCRGRGRLLHTVADSTSPVIVSAVSLRPDGWRRRDVLPLAARALLRTLARSCLQRQPCTEAAHLGGVPPP